MLYKSIVLFLTLALLTGCVAGTPTGPQPIPHPEPPIIIISVPMTLEEVEEFSYCGRQVASLSPMPLAVSPQCKDFVDHLSPKRIAEFAAAGMTALNVFRAIADGQAQIMEMARRPDQGQVAMYVIVGGMNVILILGKTINPTAFPIPGDRIPGETVRQAIDRIFASFSERNLAISATLTVALGKLFSCIADELLARQPVLEPVPANEPVSVPVGTPRVELATLPPELVYSPAEFVSNESWIAELSADEVTALVILGVVVVVGVVCIAASGGTCLAVISTIGSASATQQLILAAP